jgi:CTD kinase subunit alpha
MKEDEQGDEKRDRSPAGRGVTSSNQPGSPRGPRRGSDSSARRRPSSKALSTHARTLRQSSRDRDREGKPNRRYSNTARGEEKDDLIPRYRASKTESQSYTSGNGRGRGRGRGRDRPGSPTSPKRQRSRSRSSSARHRKKYRRDTTLSPRDRDLEADSSSRRRRHHSPPFQRQTSPYYRVSPSRRPENTASSVTRASRSRSPTRPEYESIRSSHRSREPGAGKSRRHSRSRSPGAEGRHMSQHPSHPSRERNAALANAPASRDPSSFDIDPRHSRRDRPAASPTERGARRHRRGSPEGYHSARSDIDDDMESRGAYRGGHSSVFQQKSSYRNESRGYSQSNSPTQSPYSGARPGRGGRYSPKQYVINT